MQRLAIHSVIVEFLSGKALLHCVPACCIFNIRLEMRIPSLQSKVEWDYLCFEMLG